MCNEHREFRNYVDAQIEMFRQARYDHGLPPSVLAKKSHIPLTTINGWAGGTAMPAWAFSILCRFIPDEVTNLLMEPSAKSIVPTDSEDAQLEDIFCEAAELVCEVQRARHPASPGGVAIVHSEKGPIKKRIRTVGAKARAVRS
jgi:hypothetical protein